MKMELKDIAYILGLLVLSVYTAIKERKEWSVRKRLGPNPTRCEDMAKRMKAVEESLEVIDDDIKYILTRME